MASSSSSAFASSSSSNTAQSCALCHDPLLITPHPDEEDEQLEPYLDDVLLHGACHAHWECLLDAYTQHPDPQQAKTMCAVCGKRGILDGEGRLLVDVRNEGGLTPAHDFLPEIDDALALAHAGPDHHVGRTRLFFELVRTSDYPAVEEMLRGEDEAGEEDGKVDPTVEMDGLSALDVARALEDSEMVVLLSRYGAGADEEMV